MTDRIEPTLEDVKGDGLHWRVINTTGEPIRVELRTGNGTKMLVRLPKGGEVDYFPATPDDANILSHPHIDEPGLKLVK
jgi:hypothetical protein